MSRYVDCRKYLKCCNDNYIVNPCCNNIIVDNNNSQIFRSFLNGRKEVPSNNSSATGVLLALLSPDEQRLDFILHTQGLTNIVSAHFHDAPKGVNGPIVKTIPINAISGNAIGTWTSTDSEPLTPQLVAKLKAGGIYVNVHTAAFPGGEIRAQVLQIRRNASICDRSAL